VTKPNLLHNILALSGVQALAYLLPLITLPYVTRVLGVEVWGTVALVQVVLSYFTMVTNWGFSLSGTRKVAEHRNDLDKLSEIFMTIWFAQWALFILACLVLIGMIGFVPYFESNASFYLYGIGVILGNILFPVWFLGGLERMKELAGIQLFTRSLAVPLTFIFISKPSDAPLILAISGITEIVSGTLSIYWIKKTLHLKWVLPTKEKIYQEIKEGASVFSSFLWISCYTTITPIILGLMAGATAVGYYSLADRFIKAAQSFLAPISKAIFPRLSYLYKNDFGAACRLLVKSSKVFLLISLMVSIAMWILAPYIIVLMGGEDFLPSIEILRWLSPVPFIVSLSNILGIQIMMANNKIAALNKVYGIAGVLSICILFPLIYLFGAVGASLNTLIIEIFVTIGFMLYVFNSDLFLKYINQHLREKN
jgi:O-antigen/teichoic acid export membrane protein